MTTTTMVGDEYGRDEDDEDDVEETTSRQPPFVSRRDSRAALSVAKPPGEMTSFG